MKQHPKKLVKQCDLKRFLRASEIWFAEGVCSVVCDKCEQPIKFRELAPQVWEHICRCGKYNGTMKGL